MVGSLIFGCQLTTSEDMNILESVTQDSRILLDTLDIDNG